MEFKFTGSIIGFIGAGNIAQAIAKAIISNGVSKPEHIWACAPSMNNLSKFQDIKCNITHYVQEVIHHASIIFICVKPHKIVEVLNGYSYNDSVDLVISVASGITLEFLQKYIKDVQVVRMMPNVAAQVKSGVFAYCVNNEIYNKTRPLLNFLLGDAGLLVEVPEPLVDTVCGLAGSGPAYVFTVIQSMSDGAVKMGLPRTLATKIAAQTVMGAAKMVLETEQHPDVLRDSVCSPGGTTICGLHALEKSGVRAAFMDAVEAATNRAREQNQEACKSNR